MNSTRSLFASYLRCCYITLPFHTLVLLSILWLIMLGSFHGQTLNFASATLIDHKNMIYSLPRPGILESDDCYTDIYRDDLLRDLDLMNELGVTTVMTYNGWNFGHSHKAFLTGLAKYDMSLGITFKPDLSGVMRKNLEKLRLLLEDAKVELEFVYLDYPLNFDNAEDFFQWVVQVRDWMFQEGFKCPLFVRFFPEVSDSAKIQVLLQQWDGGGFTAWAVEAYSTAAMTQWLTTNIQDNKKKLFFIYGSDSWDMINNNSSMESQALQLDSLVDFAMNGNDTMLSGNHSDHMISGAIQGYADTWYLGAQSGYFLGRAEDVCPDKNPYLHTSCGSSDLSIEYGDTYYSVEHLGILKQYETVYYFRCLTPTPAALALQQRWNPSGDPKKFSQPICSLSVSVPTFYMFYIWAAGLLVAVQGLLAGCCKSKCRACQRRKIS